MSTDPAFQLTVEDVFSIKGRGTVVTGQIESGTLKVGDEVMIKGQRPDKKAVVTGIETFRKQIQEAKTGDNVGVLLRDVTRDDVGRGDKLVSADSDFSWNF